MRKFNSAFLILALFVIGTAYGSSTGLEGTWHGTIDCLGKCRMAVEIDKDFAGGFKARYDMIELGEFGKSFEDFRVKGRKIKAKFEGDGTLDLIQHRSGLLVGTIKPPGTIPFLGGKTFPITLSPGKDYSLPRLDAQGQAVTDYTYRPPVQTGDGLETGSLKEVGGDQTQIESLVKAILNGAFPHTHSLLVLRRGKLVLEEYFYGYGPDDEHQMQSTTKSLLSMLFGIAEDRGLLDTSQKLYDYFPDYRSKAAWDVRKDQITLKTLLTMTSGFTCGEGGYRKYGGDGCDIDMINSPDWLDFCLSGSMSHEPGRHYGYCTSCLTILSALITKQSGMSLPDFAQKYLYDPLGIPAHICVTGPNGITEGGSSFWLRPRDMAKLGLMYLDKGKWKGSPVISAKWVEESTKPEPLPPDGKPWQSFEGYGYLWWTRHLPSTKGSTFVYYSNGKGGQYIIVAPALDLVCVMTAGYYRDAGSDQGLELFKQYILNAFS